MIDKHLIFLISEKLLKTKIETKTESKFKQIVGHVAIFLHMECPLPPHEDVAMRKKIHLKQDTCTRKRKEEKMVKFMKSFFVSEKEGGALKTNLHRLEKICDFCVLPKNKSILQKGFSCFFCKETMLYFRTTIFQTPPPQVPTASPHRGMLFKYTLYMLMLCSYIEATQSKAE